jgi:hypothetical protein
LRNVFLFGSDGSSVVDVARAEGPHATLRNEADWMVFVSALAAEVDWVETLFRFAR